jgi:LuxR family quorum-sensing system transcriptional regulator CciR
MDEQTRDRSDGLQLYEYLEESSRATNVQAQFRLLTCVAQALGFDFVAYDVVSGHDPELASLASALRNYPRQWQARYEAQNYRSIDPIVLRAPEAHRPILWRAVKGNGIDARQKRLFAEAAEAGLADGVSVAIHGPFGRVAVVSFVAKTDVAIRHPLMGMLHAVAIQFDFALGSIRREGGRQIQLSEREKECLSWVAAGKSSWDIGKIVGISENTVNFHIKNSMKKLDCSSRRVAIVKAIRMALIGMPVN